MTKTYQVSGVFKEKKKAKKAPFIMSDQGESLQEIGVGQECGWEEEETMLSILENWPLNMKSPLKILRQRQSLFY